MKTGEKICRERGLDFDKFPDGIPAEEFVRAGLPIVVECNGCLMTMSFPSCKVDDQGGCWCNDCASDEVDSVICIGSVICSSYTTNPNDWNYLPPVLRPPPEDYPF